MKSIHAITVGLLLLTTDARGQEETTTLGRLLDRAAVVVQARALQATDPSPEFHRIRFATESTLKGSNPGVFALLEPAGRCCARALHGMAIGSSYLLFLERRHGGYHLLGGSRGALPARAAILQHVRELAAATDESSRVRLLAAGLRHSEPRVRRDAALTLGTLRALAQAGARVRGQIRAAIDDHLQRRDAALATLLTAAVRLRMDEALGSLVPAYLAGDRPEMDRLLRAVVPALDNAAAVHAIARHLPGDAAGRRRAVELLSELPTPASNAVLLQLAAGTDRSVCVHACSTLLHRGMRRSDLEPIAPAAILDLAARQAGQGKRYRSILRGTR